MQRTVQLERIVGKSRMIQSTLKFLHHYLTNCTRTEILTSKISPLKCGLITHSPKKRRRVTSNLNKFSMLSWDVTRTQKWQCHLWVKLQWTRKLSRRRDSRVKSEFHSSNTIDLRGHSHLLLCNLSIRTTGQSIINILLTVWHCWSFDNSQNMIVEISRTRVRVRLSFGHRWWTLL